MIRRRFPAAAAAIAAWLRAELLAVAAIGCMCPRPGGLSSCHCAACHRNFTSPTAFDRHQVIGGEAVVCYDPALRGLVIVRHSRDLALWGWPGKPGRPGSVAGISAPNGGAPV
jgi:hypothetical protein